MDFLRDHSIQNELALIFISVILGLFIGAEREYRNKSAGLRTFILVCFGACLFTILSLKIGIHDPDRLAANIITGIGFLGAGVIFKNENKIEGITTATTIWATASIGMAVGSGYVYLSLCGTMLVIFILNSLTYLQNFIDSNHKIREYTIETEAVSDLKYCEKLFNENHLRFALLRQSADRESITTSWRLTGNHKKHEKFIESLNVSEKIISYKF
ncbi:magnesium transporter MgtC [Chryseobacterium sp. Leaf180]|uniref:MgtC/SapB family protein n=1 Tax=Chryseobacterium sp. Leaf180 TaxID=1736289 RepID=UPI0006FA866B|nr:MgtC/SapB family protein [Chryseobacterium sp. Leaf180]KQR93500.1 magnesium transporter MgtC [Chryseobacterium sp. Leaf180]